MKQEAFFRSPDESAEAEELSLRRDPLRVERPGPADLDPDSWPDHWAWEEDNVADGLGIGPFPTARKPPKRAERRTTGPRPLAATGTDDGSAGDE